MEKTFSRRQIVLSIAVLITVGAVAYGLLAKHEQVNKYEGLVLWQDVEMEDSVRTLINQRIKVTQAAIEAQKKATGKVDLTLLESLASDANIIGNLVLARETYEEYLSANPIDPVVWNSYGSILYWMGDYKPAEEAFRQAVTLSPSEEYYRDLVWAIDKQGDGRLSETIAILEEGVAKLGQTQWFMVDLAQRHLKAGDCESALAHYEVALTMDPNNQALKEEYSNAQQQCAK